MKIESKKIMSMFLAATLTAGGAYTGLIDTEKIGIGNVVVEAYATNDEYGTLDKLNFVEKEDGTLEVSGAYDAKGDIVIPKVFNGKIVTSIAISAFSDKTITSISMPDSIEEIKNLAFYDCEYLKTVNLSENLKKIGQTAFMYCRRLDNVIIPESIQDFGASIFSKCSNLKNITLPNNLLKIPMSMFDDCTSLNSIEVPETVIEIDKSAFTGCNNLKEVIISKNMEQIKDSAFFQCFKLETIKIYKHKDSISGAPWGAPSSTKILWLEDLQVDAEKPDISSRSTDRNYTVGDKANPLFVNASVSDGGTLSYQWFKDGKEITGETKSTCIPDTSQAGLFTYHCMLTNTNNSATGKKTASLESFPIMINVISKVDAEVPIITQQPISSTYTVGDKANQLTVIANVDDDGTLSYQWFKGDSTRIEGGKSNNFTPKTTSIGTEKYYCEITNTNNSVTGNKISTTRSNIATINVIEADPYLKSLTKLDLAYNEDVPPPMVPNPIIVNGDGYTVKKLLYNADTDTKLSEYEMTIMPYTDIGSTNRYYLKVILTKGKKRVELNTDVFTLTRRETLFPQTPVIDKDISSKTINQDDDLTLEVNASVTDGGNLTYQWFKDNNKIIGETSNVLSVKNISNLKESSYYCEITNTIDYSKKVAGGKIKSKSVNSSTATITVKEKTTDPPVEVNPATPVITKNLSEDESTYTLGDSSNEFEVEATVSDSGTLSYQWFKDNTDLIGEINNTYTPSTKELGTSEYYCQVTNTLDGKTAMAKSNTAIITVKKADNGEDNKPQEPLVNAKVPVITKDLDKSHIDTTVNKGSIDLDIEAESQDDGVLSYQWLKDGNIIDNETKESLTIDTSQTGTHLYKCLVTNTLDIATGDKTATISSKTVSITVEPKVSEPSNNRKPSRPSKPIDENTTEEKTTDEPVDEIIEIILPNPDSDTTEVPGTEKDYIYGKDKDGNIFEVEHYYDRNKKVHIIKILSEYFIIKSSVPLETTTENPMLYKEVINTGAIDTTNNFSFCSKFVNHFCLDGIKKSIKFYLTK